LNRVEAGFNSGWAQVMGPLARLAEWKAIETSTQFFGLQQLRWSPTNLADTPLDALERLFVLPGSHYQEPELSWKWAIAPAAIGFVNSHALGDSYHGDMIMGLSRTFLLGGALFRLPLSADRLHIAVSDPRLADGVADNLAKHDLTESESLLLGTDFGIVTDIQTGPDGQLYLVSLSNGAVYKISGPKQNGPRHKKEKKPKHHGNGRGHGDDNRDDDGDDDDDDNGRHSSHGRGES
jgi:hypothetical protein